VISRFQGGPLDGEYIDTGDADTWVGVEQIESPVYYNPEIPPPLPRVRDVIYTRHRRRHPGGRIESLFCLLDRVPSWEVPPRHPREICDAIKFTEDVLAHPIHQAPELVAICPTVLDGLNELLESKEKMHRMNEIALELMESVEGLLEVYSDMPSPDRTTTTARECLESAKKCLREMHREKKSC